MDLLSDCVSAERRLAQVGLSMSGAGQGRYTFACCAGSSLGVVHAH